MKKTLVIHPSDRTTDFLKLIYKGKNWDILNDFRNYTTNEQKANLVEIMKGYDRIIMMGHGLPSGLINIYDGKIYGLIIDNNFTDILKEKETISIWCNSDKFFAPRNIKGFHTGMIISEVGESLYVLGKAYLNEQETLENMNEFARIVGECIEDTPDNMKEYILEHYNFKDEITQYNRKNIIVL